jgi:hypothetical protein
MPSSYNSFHLSTRVVQKASHSPKAKKSANKKPSAGMVSHRKAIYSLLTQYTKDPNRKKLHNENYNDNDNKLGLKTHNRPYLWITN